MARFATIAIFVLSTAVLVVLQVITIHPRAESTFGIIALIALGLCVLSGISLFWKRR